MINDYLVYLGTFLICRFGIIIYMALWLIMNRSNVPFILCIIGHSGLLTMAIVNCHLIYRLVKSDFLVKQV
jgi:predicted outer membrane lipoprotein